jgi:hypothetical protein
MYKFLTLLLVMFAMVCIGQNNDYPSPNSCVLSIQVIKTEQQEITGVVKEIKACGHAVKDRYHIDQSYTFKLEGIALQETESIINVEVVRRKKLNEDLVYLIIKIK